MSDSPDSGARENARPHGSKPAGSGGRPTGGRPGSGKPYQGSSSKAKPADGAPPRGKPRDSSSGGGKPAWSKSGDSASGARGGKSVPDEKRLWTKGGAPARGDRDASQREFIEDRDPFGTRSVRSRHDDPIIPDDVSPKELDRVALNELKTLSKENAEGVAKHLVMAARLIETDPALAHQHAISAARRAGRIGVVRETLAITAYETGDYALALRELRTYRRITGRDDQLPMMVDSERGLGRPERALELGRSVARASLPVPVQVELAIAMSGARLDLGHPEAALAELQIPQLDVTTAYSYSPGLFDAYATVLEELGRTAEAEEWFARAEVAEEALAGEGDDEFVEVIEEELDDIDVASETGTGHPDGDDAR